jgi:hypothetical protein
MTASFTFRIYTFRRYRRKEEGERDYYVRKETPGRVILQSRKVLKLSSSGCFIDRKKKRNFISFLPRKPKSEEKEGERKQYSSSSN